MKTIKEAVELMKQVGEVNIRRVAAKSAGLTDIQINREGQWITILSDMNSQIAEDVIRQATNRVLLG